jgi:protein O-mannosyl-transferase
MRWIGGATKPKMFVWAGAIVIIAACFAAYIPAIKGGFIWDDDRYVTADPLLTAPDGLYRIWFSTESPSQYFPLTYTTFWVEHKLWGFNPTGYHIVNVAIHSANALLLWLVLQRVLTFRSFDSIGVKSRSIIGAWFASAVFALHPVNVESVAWITERKNVLMLFFSLLTVLCWLESVLDEKSGRKALLFYIGSLLFFALALFGKATACTMPLAMVLILWFKREPLTVKRWLQVAPFVAMGIGMGLLVMWWEKYHQGTGKINLGLTLDGKILLAGRAFWFYLWKLFWPVNLTFSYPRWHIDPTAIRQYIYPVAGILVLGGAWWWQNKIGRSIATTILFFAAMLFPMLGFFPLYTFVYSFVADHYQYVACIGPIALAAAGGERILRRLGSNGRIVVLSAAGLLLLTLGVLTWRQSRIYTNRQTLWSDTLNKNPDSWLAHGEISIELLKQGKFEDVKSHMEQKVKLSSYMKTVNPHIYASSYCDLATIFEAQGKLDYAVSYYQKSLDIYDNLAFTHYRFAVMLANQGNYEMALPHLRRAMEIAKAQKNNHLAELSSKVLNLIEEKRKNPNNQKLQQQRIHPDNP